MANIFYGLEKLADDSLRMQIAILKNVNLINSVMETGSRAVNKLISAAGNFLSAFSGSDKTDESDVINVKIIRVKDKIIQTYNELEGNDRKQLEELLKKEIAEKCLMTLSNDSEGISIDKYAVMAVREAAGAYGLDIRQPPAFLTDQIKEKYYSHLVKVLHARLVREDDTARKATDNACTLVLRKIDIERLRDLNRELHLVEFNPRSIMAAVRADRTQYTLEKVLSVMGFEAFDLMACIIATVNDGMKSLISANRILLANLVWVASVAYGKKFSVNGDTLPSFVNNGRSSGVNEVDVRFMESAKKAEGFEKKIKRHLAEISDNNRRHVLYENDLLQARAEQDEARQEWIEAKTENDDAAENGKRAKSHLDDYERLNPIRDNSNMDYRQLKSEYEMAATKVRSAQLRLDRATKNLARKDRRVEDIRLKIKESDRKAKELGDSLYILTKEYNDIIFNVDNEAGERSLHLSRKWEKFFYDLQFDKNIFEDVVKWFGTSELYQLEFYLQELNEASDTSAYAHDTLKENGEITGYVAYCLVAVGKYAAVTYYAKSINKIEIKDK